MRHKSNKLIFGKRKDIFSGRVLTCDMTEYEQQFLPHEDPTVGLANPVAPGGRATELARFLVLTAYIIQILQPFPPFVLPVSPGGKSGRSAPTAPSPPGATLASACTLSTPPDTATTGGQPWRGDPAGTACSSASTLRMMRKCRGTSCRTGLSAHLPILAECKQDNFLMNIRHHFPPIQTRKNIRARNFQGLKIYLGPLGKISSSHYLTH